MPARLHRCRNCQQPGHNRATCTNPSVPRPPRARSAAAIERNRIACRNRYTKRGGWGGRRVPGERVTVVTEGSTTRIECRCGAFIAGNFDASEVAEMVTGHKARCPLATKRPAVVRKGWEQLAMSGAA